MPDTDSDQEPDPKPFITCYITIQRSLTALSLEYLTMVWSQTPNLYSLSNIYWLHWFWDALLVRRQTLIP